MNRGEGKSVHGFNRGGGGNADGSGGFAKVGGATLEDGQRVEEVFDELADTLQRAGYYRKWVDGWYRDADGACVTHGYSYREVRVRRYFQHGGGPQALLNIRRYTDLDQIEAFVGPAVTEWGEWTADGAMPSVVAS